MKVGDIFVFEGRKFKACIGDADYSCLVCAFHGSVLCDKLGDSLAAFCVSDVGHYFKSIDDEDNKET